ncbi:hypothetical protein [Sphingomonas sp. ERG5]|uniref:hypothetical protein n=1 Tax=Sphingomonas sp. ERG5 TaxID=1381597 RepID=UPI001364C6B7|nr:hypothetical protein [Sphingomonas sp. ERG5]
MLDLLGKKSVLILLIYASFLLLFIAAAKPRSTGAEYRIPMPARQVDRSFDTSVMRKGVRARLEIPSGATLPLLMTALNHQARETIRRSKERPRS